MQAEQGGQAEEGEAKSRQEHCLPISDVSGGVAMFDAMCYLPTVSHLTHSCVQLISCRSHAAIVQAASFPFRGLAMSAPHSDPGTPSSQTLAAPQGWAVVPVSDEMPAEPSVSEETPADQTLQPVPQPVPQPADPPASPRQETVQAGTAQQPDPPQPQQELVQATTAQPPSQPPQQWQVVAQASVALLADPLPPEQQGSVPQPVDTLEPPQQDSVAQPTPQQTQPAAQANVALPTHPPQQSQQHLALQTNLAPQADPPHPEQVALQPRVSQPTNPPRQQLALWAFAAPQGQPVLMSADMMRTDPRFQRQQNKVSHKKAHDWLNLLRGEVDPNAQDALDMSHDARFDWQCYVAFRPDAGDVIGEGITKFEFRYLHVSDSNTHQRRSDFVVHRVDGTCVRLHPSSSGKPNAVTNIREAVPIYGRLEDWVPQAFVASQGPRQGEDDAWGQHEHVHMANARLPPGHPGYQHVSRADLYCRREARAFLTRKHEEWAATGCRGPFYRLVTATEWNWPVYLANCRAADSINQETGGVVRFGIARTADTHPRPALPAFWGETAQGTRFQLIPNPSAPDFFRPNWDDLW